MRMSHQDKEQREEPRGVRGTHAGPEAGRVWHIQETVRRAVWLEPSEQGGEGQERRLGKPSG